MGIKFRCRACDKKLHVKAFLAGRRGVCPKCGAKIRIPLASEEAAPAAAAVVDAPHEAARAASAAGARNNAPVAVTHEAARAVASATSTGRATAGSGVHASAAHDPIAEAPDAVWYVRPPTGGQFGPADGTIMRRWLNEGRVSADALVWREGWPDWKSAGPVFPSLEAPDLPAPGSAAADVAGVAEGDFAFAEERRPAGRQNPRSHSRPVARNVTLVATLLVLCVVLVVALVIVLRMQG
jgi:hypothetical protein